MFSNLQLLPEYVWKILDDDDDDDAILSDSFGSHFYLAMEISPVGGVIPCLSGEMPISPPFPGEALLPIAAKRSTNKPKDNEEVPTLTRKKRKRPLSYSQIWCWFFLGGAKGLIMDDLC